MTVRNILEKEDEEKDKIGMLFKAAWRSDHGMQGACAKRGNFRGRVRKPDSMSEFWPASERNRQGKEMLHLS